MINDAMSHATRRSRDHTLGRNVLASKQLFPTAEQQALNLLKFTWTCLCVCACDTCKHSSKSLVKFIATLEAHRTCHECKALEGTPTRMLSNSHFSRTTPQFACCPSLRFAREVSDVSSTVGAEQLLGCWASSTLLCCKLTRNPKGGSAKKEIPWKGWFACSLSICREVSPLAFIFGRYMTVKIHHHFEASAAPQTFFTPSDGFCTQKEIRRFSQDKTKWLCQVPHAHKLGQSTWPERFRSIPSAPKSTSNARLVRGRGFPLRRLGSLGHATRRFPTARSAEAPPLHQASVCF